MKSTDLFGKVSSLVKTMVMLIICAVLTCGVSAQQRHVTGQLTNVERNPLAGATIIVKGTSIGTTTDAYGHYSLNIPTGIADAELEFFFLGYISKSEALGSRSVVNVVLEEDVAQIEQVVVIGYGTTTKKEVTGSVASLKAENFNIGSFSDPIGLIQGKVAGLNILNTSGGDPSGSMEISIRGVNTLKAGSSPLLIVDGVMVEDLKNVNFNEIESFDVLKDGSAAAIYGPRGTNGVILITTKRAKAGVMRVEYFGQVSTQLVQSRPKSMNAEQFTNTINQYMPHLTSNLYGHDTDWFDEITRTPVSHKHNVAVSGGSEKFSHHTSFSFENNQGLQRKNEVQKTLMRTNIRQNAFEGWLDMDYNMYIGLRKSKPSNRAAFYQAFIYNPTEPVYDDSNADYTGGYSRQDALEYYNPVAMINECTTNNESDDFGGNIRGVLNILPVDGLKWDNFISYGKSRYEGRDYRTRYYPTNLGTNGIASIDNNRYSNLVWESTLNYRTNIARHSLQAMLGYSYQDINNRTSSMTNRGFDRDDFETDNIGVGTGLTDKTASMSSYRSNKRYIAFFGRVMYNYNNKYMLSASLRRDGASIYGIDNKWGWFPSVSVGWRLGTEDFMSSATWLDELKIRAGYGTTGNLDFSPYQSLMLLGVDGKFLYNGEWINTYAPVSNANGKLKWERKIEYNIGIDFSLFKGILSGNVDLYSRKSKDLLNSYDVPTPPYLYPTLFTNVGQISNRGIEVTLSSTPVKSKDFSWMTTFVLSHNKNKLDKLTDENFSKTDTWVGWVGDPITTYVQRLVEGESLGTFYGPVWLGVDANGEDQLKGQNASGMVDQDDWEVIGQAFPKATLGWSNTFIYKNFDLSFSFRASLGGKVLNQYAMMYENINRIGTKNILASWADNPEFTGTIKYSSKYLENATYLKLDNITLGYNIKFDTRYIHGVRLYANAQNVFCLTRYSGTDPEVALNSYSNGLVPGIDPLTFYPRTTALTFGVNLSF